MGRKEQKDGNTIKEAESKRGDSAPRFGPNGRASKKTQMWRRSGKVGGYSRRRLGQAGKRISLDGHAVVDEWARTSHQALAHPMYPGTWPVGSRELTDARVGVD